MNRKVLFGSIFAVALIILVSFASVVGHQSTQTEKQESFSPLFSVRTQRAIQKLNTKGITTFLGKSTPSHLFPSTTANEEMIQSAIKILARNPALLDKLVENLDQYPYIARLITNYDIDISAVKHSIKQIQDNPSLLTDYLANIQIPGGSDDDPQPLGLSTSNPLGCFIVAIVALIPVTITLTLLLLLFTLRVLTCMNFNDCANDIANQIWSQLTQGLTQE